MLCVNCHSMFPVIAHDLDGEALVAAIDHGLEALKEALPSLGKQLKLISCLKTIQDQPEVCYMCEVYSFYSS